MNVLFIGDSITRGTQGVDWVKMIENEHPYWTIENAGVNGETLTKISKRLKSLVQLNNSYKAIVLQTATHDILLPTFRHRNFWFQKDYKRQLKSGNKPIAPPEFELVLKRTVEYVRSTSNSEIVLPTLGCINENPLAETNAQLFSYNSIIKKVAKEFNCILADIAEKFQEELGGLNTQDYCLENFSNTAFFDLVSCSMGMADNLSAKRKLHLTIDGVHLNSKGAKIFKEEIDKAILLTKEKSALFI